MIVGYYKKTVSTKRLAGTEHKKALVENLTGLACAIHPINAKQLLSIGSAFYNLYNMYCATGTDIKINDQIVDGSDTYRVQLVADYSDVDSSNKHMVIKILKG